MPILLVRRRIHHKEAQVKTQVKKLHHDLNPEEVYIVSLTHRVKIRIQCLTRKTKKSKNRIDSDSDESVDKGTGSKKDLKDIGKFSMTLRDQRGFEEVSLKAENPRKRSREEMEPTLRKQTERPTQTPQGEKILYSRPWTPVYFTQSGAQARQVPSQAVYSTKKCNGKVKRFRSEGVQSNYTRRVIRRPQRYEPVDLEPWQQPTMASLNFRLHARTDQNVIWIKPKDSQSEGKFRYRPATLAMKEVKHFMGVATTDQAYATGGLGESGLILPKAAMRRVILELGMNRMENIRFESVVYHIIHYAAEHYFTQIYQDAVMLASHMKRCTVSDKDRLLARHLTGDYKAHDVWRYQRCDQLGVDIVHNEADLSPEQSKWSYQHQEWKSDAWKKGKWDVIEKS